MSSISVAACLAHSGDVGVAQDLLDGARVGLVHIVEQAHEVFERHVPADKRPSQSACGHEKAIMREVEEQHRAHRCQ